MHSLKLCKQYLSFVNNGDLAGVLSLFTPNAVVVSPLSGTMAIEPFHQKLFADVKQSRTSVKNIFATVNDVSSVALHFAHAWLLANGGLFEFEGINVFELSEDGRKFSKLTIIYDSAPLRHRLGEEAVAS
jgi:ketosteroid isomerase-like protein